MTNQDLEVFFEKEFANIAYCDVPSKLKSTRNHPHFQDLCRMCCNALVSTMTDDYIRYGDDISIADIKNWETYKCFSEIVKQLDQESSFYLAFFYFLQQDQQMCKNNLHKLILNWKQSACTMCEVDFIFLFILPFKNAFEGFWPFIVKELNLIDSDDNVRRLCDVAMHYYACSDENQRTACLQKYIQQYPSLCLLHEWLGYTYFSMSMWRNAIACLEKAETPVFFTDETFDWMLAWSYGKIKDYSNEEIYYKKCQKVAPEKEFLLNNLGYCLYQQKRYSEAEALFKECLQKEIDLPYAANNYVRVLLATGRQKAAKDFIQEGKFRVSKNLRDKASKAEGACPTAKKAVSIAVEAIETDGAIQNKTAKKMQVQQFSSEKLLEDELTARMEAGQAVFGLNLKIYRRHGEYGRQYIIPIGRIDLLCEDAAGNLYVIELKKDSGYDDPYMQLAAYLDWFEASEKFKGKNISGIICLNQPKQALLDQVHADKRIKLYEYQIVYIER